LSRDGVETAEQRTNIRSHWQFERGIDSTFNDQWDVGARGGGGAARGGEGAMGEGPGEAGEEGVSPIAKGYAVIEAKLRRH
jgi:hypothetical protein